MATAKITKAELKKLIKQGKINPEIYPNPKRTAWKESITFTAIASRITTKPRMTKSDKWKKRSCVLKWLNWKDTIRLAYLSSRGKMYVQPVVLGYVFTIANHRTLDIDNLIKAINDSLNKTAWPDDCLKYVRGIDYAIIKFNIGPKMPEMVEVSIRPL